MSELSDADVNARLEHQFSLLDQNKDGLLSQQERAEVWVDFLQPVADRFFPDNDVLTFEEFCEKDHRLVPSMLNGDEQ